MPSRDNKNLISIIKKANLAIGHKTISHMQGLLSALHKKRKEHAQADLFLALYLNEHLALLTCKMLVPPLCAVTDGDMLNICFLAIISVGDLFSRNKNRLHKFCCF